MSTRLEMGSLMPVLGAYRKTAITFALLLVAVVLSALVVVYNSYLNRQLFISLNSSNQQYNAMRIDYGRLQLEYGTWASPAFIEREASQKLHMQAPQAGQIVLVPVHLTDRSVSQKSYYENSVFVAGGRQ